MLGGWGVAWDVVDPLWIVCHVVRAIWVAEQPVCAATWVEFSAVWSMWSAVWTMWTVVWSVGVCSVGSCGYHA